MAEAGRLIRRVIPTNRQARKSGQADFSAASAYS